MRHTFAHFSVAFLTGALTAPIIKSYISELISREIHTVHSMDNQALTQPKEATLQSTVATPAPHDSSCVQTHIDKDAFLESTVMLYGKGDQHIGIRAGCRLQHLVTLAALPEGSVQPESKNPVRIGHERYAIYIGERSILDRGTRVMSPALIEQDVYIGPDTIITHACVRTGVIIEQGAIVSDVEIPPYRYIQAGQVIRSQYEADQLPFCQDQHPPVQVQTLL